MLIDHISFTVSSIAGYLGSFCYLPIVDSVLVNLNVHVSFLSAIFDSFSSVPRCDRSGSYEDSIFSSVEFYLTNLF